MAGLNPESVSGRYCRLGARRVRRFNEPPLKPPNLPFKCIAAAEADFDIVPGSRRLKQAVSDVKACTDGLHGWMCKPTDVV